MLSLIKSLARKGRPGADAPAATVQQQNTHAAAGAAAAAWVREATAQGLLLLSPRPGAAGGPPSGVSLEFLRRLHTLAEATLGSELETVSFVTSIVVL